MFRFLLTSLKRQSFHGHFATRNCSETKAWMWETKARLELSEDNASFRYLMPGFSLHDVDLMQFEPYLRTWRVAYTMYLCIELAKRNGFCQFWCSNPGDRTYEDTHMTFVKAVSLNRVADLRELDSLDQSPYQRQLAVSYRLSYVGSSSFQLNGRLEAAASGRTLFQTTMVCVCVDRRTRQVSAHPRWWLDKYGSASRRRSADRIRLDVENDHETEAPLTRMSLVIQPEHLDFYNHVNNAHFADFALNAMLKARLEGSVLWTRRQIERNIKYTVFNFLSPCVLNDRLDVALYKDRQKTNTFYITFHKANIPAYVQFLQYEMPSARRNV